MGLRESSVLSGLHPWLAIRVRWLGEVIEAWGGVQIYLSGLRTEAEQIRLMRSLAQKFSSRPVAGPGCSQHQYGYAVDVAWGLLREQSALGHFNPKEINDLMSDLGRSIGLVTVAQDSGHFQIFPGSEFRSWSVASGFCDPAETNRLRDQFAQRAVDLFDLRERDRLQLERNIGRLFINP